MPEGPQGARNGSHVDDQVVLMDTMRQLGQAVKENEELVKDIKVLKEEREKYMEELHASRGKIQDLSEICELHKETQKTNQDRIEDLQLQFQEMAVDNQRLKEEQSASDDSLGTSINQTGWDGKTPLHRAAENGKMVFVRALIDAGTDINKTTSLYGWTALHLAAREGHEAVSQFLIKAGVDVNQTNYGGWTSLHESAQNGHEAVVRVLIDEGAALNTTIYIFDWTPLHLAAHWGHEAVTQLLVDKGADIYKKDNKGRTPINIAGKRNHNGVVRVLANAGA